MSLFENFAELRQAFLQLTSGAPAAVEVTIFFGHAEDRAGFQDRMAENFHGMNLSPAIAEEWRAGALSDSFEVMGMSFWIGRAACGDNV